MFNGRFGLRAALAATCACALAGGVTPAAHAIGVSGPKANSDSYHPTLSENGRYLAFETVGTNLSPDDTSSNTDVYVRDLDTGVTVLASRPSGTTALTGTGS